MADLVFQSKEQSSSANKNQKIARSAFLADYRETRSDGLQLKSFFADGVAENRSGRAGVLADNRSDKIVQRNNTGLPDQLKSGVESLSGLSMDHVKVHYNSSGPAQLNAHAYARGNDIHLAPGQEKHLPHEAWHVVQQAQGRVRPTAQMKGGVAVNDDIGLEAEADVMGAKALQLAGKDSGSNGDNAAHNSGHETGCDTLQKKAGNAFSGSTANAGVAQLMKFQYVASNVKETKTVKAKLAQVIPVLEKVLAKFGDGKTTVTLKLINEGGMSPAYSSHNYDPIAAKYTGGALITLNQWYAERASVGDIVGMLIHELGVHGMADLHMGLELQPGGGLAADPNTPFAKERASELAPHTLNGVASGPHTLAPVDRTNTKDRRQEDHVNIGKGLISKVANSRAQVYIETFLEAGKAINHNTTISSKDRKKQLSDLMQSFFFDIARIVATDDGTAFAMFSKTGAIAELMNYYHKEVVAKHSRQYPWLEDKELQLSVNGGALRKRLLGLLGELALSSNPSVQKGRGILGGSLVAAGAYTLGGFAAGPALAAGAVAGLGIWGVSKMLGYLS